MNLELEMRDLSIVKIKHGGAFVLPSSGFFYFFRSTDETSLVCMSKDVPPDAVDRNDGWVGFKVLGPLDFGLVGIMAELSGLLATVGISLIALSTYDTDWILVKAEQADHAAEAWRKGGHHVVMDAIQPIETPHTAR